MPSSCWQVFTKLQCGVGFHCALSDLTSDSSHLLDSSHSQCHKVRHYLGCLSVNSGGVPESQWGCITRGESGKGTLSHQHQHRIIKWVWLWLPAPQSLHYQKRLLDTSHFQEKKDKDISHFIGTCALCCFDVILAGDQRGTQKWEK